MDKSIPQGAATTVWACVSPTVDAERETYAGAYCADCAVAQPKTKEAKDVSGVLREELQRFTQMQLQDAVAKAGL